MNKSEFKREIVVGVLPKILYHIEVDKETRSQMEAIGDLLARRPELSIAAYFNHGAYPDPGQAAWVLHQIAGRQDMNWLAPASYSHSEKVKPRSKTFLYLMDLAGSCGIEIVRVIQEYQVDNPEYGYTQEQANETYKQFLRRLEIRRSQKSVVSMISTEGHRSPNNELQVGLEGGIKALGKKLAPIVYVPTGIIYEEPFNRGRDKVGLEDPSIFGKLGKIKSTIEDLNFGKRVRLTLGQIYIQETRNDFPGIDYLMKNLAEALPPEMRGVYA
jgi:hypothetical protein